MQNAKACQARVVIRQVSVECPHCGASVQMPEGRDNHTFDVFVDPGLVNCGNCKEAFDIPDLTYAFRHMRLPKEGA